jgi:amino acid transporter
VYVGVKESRNFSNVMVVLKLCIIILVIAVGAYYINPDNWTPANDAGYIHLCRMVSAGDACCKRGVLSHT